MANTKNKIDGACSKIERAVTHVQDLREKITAFLDTRPLELFTATGPDQHEACIKVRATREVPIDIAILSGEIIYALRSALDQLTCALASQNGHSDVSSTYFPIAGTKDDYDSKKTKQKVSKLHPEAVSVINSFKPYRGGNDLLWILNKLGNIDKHQMLIPMAAANLGTQLQLSGRPLGIFEHTFKAVTSWQSAESEATIFIYPAGMQLEGEITILTDISFRDIMVTGQPAIRVLEAFIMQTQDIMEQLKRFF